MLLSAPPTLGPPAPEGAPEGDAPAPAEPEAPQAADARGAAPASPSADRRGGDCGDVAVVAPAQQALARTRVLA